MNFIKEILLPLAALLFAMLAVVGALTLVWVNNLESECVANGGTHSVEGADVWCRY
jgi:hypothetical protein